MRSTWVGSGMLETNAKIYLASSSVRPSVQPSIHQSILLFCRMSRHEKKFYKIGTRTRTGSGKERAGLNKMVLDHLIYWSIRQLVAFWRVIESARFNLSVISSTGHLVNGATTFSIMDLIVTLSVNDSQHINTRLKNWMLLCWVIMLSVVNSSLLCWVSLCWTSWHPFYWLVISPPICFINMPLHYLIFYQLLVFVNWSFHHVQDFLMCIILKFASNGRDYTLANKC